MLERNQGGGKGGTSTLKSPHTKQSNETKMIKCSGILVVRSTTKAVATSEVSNGGAIGGVELLVLVQRRRPKNGGGGGGG
jgi:hypothetical protein